MTRVLLAGGSGFIGRPLAQRMIEAGYEVHVASRRGGGPDGAHRHTCDLLDAGAAEALVGNVRPSHLVHLAWFTVPGVFWHTELENQQWVAASARLIDAFVTRGGERLVGVGSAAELESTPSPYGTAKSAVRSMVEGDGTSGASVSSAWVRLFQPYGPGEDPARLIPTVIRQLLAGEVVETTAGEHERDFIYIDDVVAALFAVAVGNLCGAMDLGTGVGTRVRDVVLGLADRIGGADLVHIGARPLAAHEPARLVANPVELESIGWRPATDVQTGLDRTVRWWQER